MKLRTKRIGKINATKRWFIEKNKIGKPLGSLRNKRDTKSEVKEVQTNHRNTKYYTGIL